MLGIVATGDEVVAPGTLLPEGKLFASNLFTLNSWCRHYGMRTKMEIVGDKPEAIKEKLSSMIQKHYAILISGGAWIGGHDFIVSVLEDLEWQKIFHHIRIDQGKAVGFELIKNKPVFILPGDLPSNLMAFLQIALPGLMKLAGYRNLGLPRIKVILSETVIGREIDWTQFIFCRFEEKENQAFSTPSKW